MHEIQRYVSEAMRVRRVVQIYFELYESQESIDLLMSASTEVCVAIRRSMHDEILISLARLFDGEKYNGYEYLSQRNLVNNHISSMNLELTELRNKTSSLWKEIAVKEYRDFKVAHNDKNTIMGLSQEIKHNISFEKVVQLLETSIILVLKLQSSITGKETIEVWSNLNDKCIGEGTKFVSKLKT